MSEGPQRATPRSWTEQMWALVAALREPTATMDDVLVHLEDARSPVRLAVAEWFDFGDEHFTVRDIDLADVTGPMTADGTLLPRRPTMPDSVARRLLRDPDDNVVLCTALRARTVPELLDLARDPARSATVRGYATTRLVTLGAHDPLRRDVESGRDLSRGAARALARNAPEPDLLSALMTGGGLDADLVENPHLPATLLARLDVPALDKVGHRHVTASIVRLAGGRGALAGWLHEEGCPGTGRPGHDRVEDTGLPLTERLDAARRLLGEYGWRGGDLAHADRCVLPLAYATVDAGGPLEQVAGSVQDARSMTWIFRHSGGQESLSREWRCELVALGDHVRAQRPAEAAELWAMLDLPPDD